MSGEGVLLQEVGSCSLIRSSRSSRARAGHLPRRPGRGRRPAPSAASIFLAQVEDRLFPSAGLAHQELPPYDVARPVRAYPESRAESRPDRRGPRGRGCPGRRSGDDRRHGVARRRRIRPTAADADHRQRARLRDARGLEDELADAAGVVAKMFAPREGIGDGTGSIAPPIANRPPWWALIEAIAAASRCERECRAVIRRRDGQRPRRSVPVPRVVEPRRAAE